MAPPCAHLEALMTVLATRIRPSVAQNRSMPMAAITAPTAQASMTNAKTRRQNRARRDGGVEVMTILLPHRKAIIRSQVGGRAIPTVRPAVAARRGSIRRRLDRRHVVVGETEVVADLMHEHVGDDSAQRLVVLG